MLPSNIQLIFAGPSKAESLPQLAIGEAEWSGEKQGKLALCFPPSLPQRQLGPVQKLSSASTL